MTRLTLNQKRNRIYKDMDHERRMVRLFRLDPGYGSNIVRGTFVYKSLDDNPSYEALSYVWGNSGFPYKCSIEDNEIGIGLNLYEALIHLRLPASTRMLWVDAICINQSNTEEMSHQLRMMDEVYHHADNVLIWLGTGTAHSSYGMQALESFSRGSLSPKSVPWLKGSTHQWRTGLLEIMDNPYFTRIWVVQEAALARKATMLCGMDQFSWNNEPTHVRAFARSLKLASILPSWSEGDFQAVNTDAFRTLLELQLSQVDGIDGRPVPDFLDIAYDLRHRKGRDRRDLLYALLNLRQDRGLRDQISPDYSKTVDEVYNDFIRIFDRDIRKLSE